MRSRTIGSYAHTVATWESSFETAYGPYNHLTSSREVLVVTIAGNALRALYGCRGPNEGDDRSTVGCICRGITSLTPTPDEQLIPIPSLRKQLIP
jgi:hypothetical protein